MWLVESLRRDAANFMPLLSERYAFAFSFSVIISALLTLLLVFCFPPEVVGQA